MQERSEAPLIVGLSADQPVRITPPSVMRLLGALLAGWVVMGVVGGITLFGISRVVQAPVFFLAMLPFAGCGLGQWRFLTRWVRWGWAWVLVTAVMGPVLMLGLYMLLGILFDPHFMVYQFLTGQVGLWLTLLGLLLGLAQAGILRNWRARWRWVLASTLGWAALTALVVQILPALAPY